MKRIIYTLIGVSAILTSCQKWTETENMTEELEKIALEDLRNKRDNAKWEAEAQRTEENKKALEAYWATLREYKQKAWLNTGEAGGQKPMVYFWFSGGFWTAQKGVAKTWLQSIPDSVTCISMWGGLGGMRPEALTENQKKDLEIFHKKGSAVLMCWQTPSVGTALPGKKDGSLDGYRYFREKYPFDDNYAEWPAIYARELSRYIIALGLDGYDVDWETCGDHGAVTREGTPLMVKDNDYENIANFVKEMAKYFGPVGANNHVKTQAEREANLKALFDSSTAGFHANEKEFIDDFKPYLPEDYLTKRYYFCADVPCYVPPIFRTGTLEIYFDKHFLQNYDANDEKPSPGWNTPLLEDLGGKYYNSAGANYQAGNFKVLEGKAKTVREGKVWGLAAYHGQTDYEINDANNEQFKSYLQKNNLKRRYFHYAWTREAIRIADPRPDYSGYVEKEPYIITP